MARSRGPRKKSPEEFVALQGRACARRCRRTSPACCAMRCRYRRRRSRRSRRTSRGPSDSATRGGRSRCRCPSAYRGGDQTRRAIRGQRHRWYGWRRGTAGLPLETRARVVHARRVIARGWQLVGARSRLAACRRCRCARCAGSLVQRDSPAPATPRHLGPRLLPGAAYGMACWALARPWKKRDSTNARRWPVCAISSTPPPIDAVAAESVVSQARVWDCGPPRRTRCPSWDDR